MLALSLVERFTTVVDHTCRRISFDMAEPHYNSLLVSDLLTFFSCSTSR